MSTLLSTIEQGILAMVAPLVGAGGEAIKSATVAEFKGAESLTEVLDMYRTRLPGLVLSIPDVTIEKRPDRLLDVRLSYGVLIGFSDRRDMDTRRAFLYELHDELARVLWLQRIPLLDFGIVATDVIRPSNVIFAVDAGDNIGALFATFEVTVHGWKINTPASGPLT